jgi:hypothetical protein
MLPIDKIFGVCTSIFNILKRWNDNNYIFLFIRSAEPFFKYATAISPKDSPPPSENGTE